MEPREIQKAGRELLKLIGGSADLSISIECKAWREKPLSLLIWPFGIGNRNSYGETIRVDGDTWTELFAVAQSEWLKQSEKHRASLVRKMALEIIRLTAEGNCTDAALRGMDAFNPDDIERYGELACADADLIASNGPFKIKRAAKANAA